MVDLNVLNSSDVYYYSVVNVTSANKSNQSAVSRPNGLKISHHLILIIEIGLQQQ